MSRVGIIVGKGFEDSEFTEPERCIRAAGHQVVVIGERAGDRVRGKQGDAEVRVELAACDVHLGDFDAIVIPGGHAPDRLRMNSDVVAVVRASMEAGKTVAAICHGPQLLIEADEVRGRTLTSWPSVRTDLIDAGANWVDKVVVVDGNLITSRKPADLDAFCKTIVEHLERV